MRSGAALAVMMVMAASASAAPSAIEMAVKDANRPASDVSRAEEICGACHKHRVHPWSGARSIHSARHPVQFARLIVGGPAVLREPSAPGVYVRRVREGSWPNLAR